MNNQAEKVGELDELMKDVRSAEDVADIQDTMLELKKLTGKQATEAVQKSEAKYAKYMDKVLKPFEDILIAVLRIGERGDFSK